MALPVVAAAALKYGPAAFGIIKGLFGGKSKEEKMREEALGRLRQIAQKGLDPGVLNRAIGILNERIGGEQQSTLARLAAGGLDPSSGLAQEASGAIRRSRGVREGEARALFNEQSERAKAEANQYLAGLPVQQDDSLGSALSSVGTSLIEDFSEGGLFNRKSPITPPTAESVGQYVRGQAAIPSPVGEADYIPKAPNAVLPTYKSIQNSMRGKSYLRSNRLPGFYNFLP